MFSTSGNFLKWFICKLCYKRNSEAYYYISQYFLSGQTTLTFPINYS